jgi:hypothetical protein
MKKLMFAAIATAVTSGAFAYPLVYNYKASVKHMFLEQKTIKAYDKKTYDVYLKVQKQASLKGYLVMDQDGVTSKAVSNGNCDGGHGGDGTYAFDYGRGRGFLIVVNQSAAKNFRTPKIIPAVLDGKWMDTKYSAADMPTTGLAEGYLFLGGDSVQCVRPFVDLKTGGTQNKDEVSRATVPTPPAAAVPGMSALADYLWTSVFLFGQFNGPNWFDRRYAKAPVDAGPFDQFETLWDANLPKGVQIGFAYFHPYYHDTWMNGSGFGRYVIPSKTVGKLCCGLKKTTTSQIVLESLAGSVKGGLFLCTENLIDAENQEYVFFDGDMHRWEDQFNASRVVDQDNMFEKFVEAPADRWQNDMWNDGAVEQETTDVITGNWQIKLFPNFFADKGLFDKFGGDADLDVTVTIDDDPVDASVVAGAEDLYKTLWVAAYDLDKSVPFVENFEHSSHRVYEDGDPENDLMWSNANGLPGITESVFISVLSGQRKLPVATPAFLKYYGIINY